MAHPREDKLNMSIDGMRRIRAPELTAGQTRVLAAAYEENCSRPMERLSEAAGDPVRKRLDEAVCDALGLAAGASRPDSFGAGRRTFCNRPPGRRGRIIIR